MVLDGILRREDMEGTRQLPGGFVDGDTAIGHRLEQCRLRLWTRSVDLVGEHHVCKQRALLETQGAFALIEDRDADEV